MSFNLLDSVKGLFTSDTISKMASSFGESEGGIQKAIGGAIPAVLVGLLNKASSSDGAASLLNLSKDAASSGMLGNLGNLLGGGGGNLLGKGMDMLKGLFGDKTNAITSMIASYGGIRESSASSLLSVAAPAALGTVGKQVTQNNLGVSGLTSWLAQQKDSIMSAVPSGLNIAGALGLGSLSDLGNKLSGLLGTAGGSVKHVAGTASAYAHETTEKAKGGAKWLWPLLLALLVILALIYFLRGKGRKDDIAPAPTEQTTPAPDTTATVNTAPTLESIKVRLPDGTELDAYRGGIEDRLVAFLNDPNSKGGKDVWFDFDNLNFKTGSAEITDESMVQVNNIAAILKAYPKLVIKIGGYTDKSGDEKVNMKLSQDRANAVSNSLKGKGANNKQIAGAEGYGSQFAKAAADAPDEERKKDRRIAVGVREK